MTTPTDNGAHKRRSPGRGPAVRTAWLLGAVAALIFIVFILSGVLKS